MAQSNKFWPGGRSAYIKQLDEQEVRMVDPLRQSLKSENDLDVKRRLKQEIKVIQEEFKQKRKQARENLFSKQG